MKHKEEEQELVFGQRFDDYRTFKDKGIDASTFGSTEEKPAPKTRNESFNDRFIKGERGKLIRRGSPTAQRAENREAARNRAKKAALKRKGK